jgi:DNA-binding transcriptional MocR family regulator
MHALVKFSDERVVARANQSRVQLTTADACYMTRPPRGQAILGFAGMGERTIREGVKRLSYGTSSL